MRETIDISRRRLLRGDVQVATDTIASIDEQCLANNNVACRSCEDHCDVEAIRFVPQIGGHYTPFISKECTSCGGCLNVCPVSAISLKPIPITTVSDLEGEWDG